MLPLILTAALFAANPSSEPLEITAVHGSQAEIATAEQLNRLVGQHEVDGWIFTTDIAIDETAIPHSHPMLTLHTRYLDDDDSLLATFLHEQFHWFLVEQEEAGEAAMNAFATLYPAIPVGYPDGARDARSNQRHLIVCLLEFDAMTELVGEARARRVLEGYGHYQVIYRIVLDDPEALRRVIREHGIALPDL